MILLFHRDDPAGALLAMLAVVRNPRLAQHLRPKPLP
jgi:hypothetical protein